MHVKMASSDDLDQTFIDRNTISRFPLIKVACSCENRFPYIERNYTGDVNTPHPLALPKTPISVTEINDKSESEDDNDEDLNVAEILTALRVYDGQCNDKRYTEAKKTIMLNLIGSFECKEDVDDDLVKNLLRGCISISNVLFSQIEMKLLFISKLCVRDNNALKFLYHESMTEMILILSSSSNYGIKIQALKVIEKLASHHSLDALWLDSVIPHGLLVVFQHLDHQQPFEVQLAAAWAVTSLVQYKPVAELVIEKAMLVIMPLRLMAAQFQQAFICILSGLLLHSNQKILTTFDNTTMTSALQILQMGPCNSQTKCLQLFLTMSSVEIGLDSLLKGNATQHILSCFIDSECRVVRCLAIQVLNAILAKTTTLESKTQLLLKVDDFYHEDEDNIFFHKGTLSCNKERKGNKSLRIERAIQDLVKSFTDTIMKNGRIEKCEEQGVERMVGLTPNIDTDKFCLKTLTYSSRCLEKLVKMQLYIKSFKDVQLSKDDTAKLWREMAVDGNPYICQTLLDKNGTCVLDLLHVYSLKFHHSNHVTNRSKPKRAWSATSKRPISAKSSFPKLSESKMESIFNQNEIALIIALLDLIISMTRASRFPSKENQTIASASDEPTYPDHFATFDGTNEMCSTLTSQEPNSDQRQYIMQSYKSALRKLFTALHISIKKTLFVDGVIQTVAPWLLSTDSQIKHKVFEILLHMSFHINEHLPKPPSKPPALLAAEERAMKIKTLISEMSVENGAKMRTALGLDINEEDEKRNQIISSQPNNLRDFATKLERLNLGNGGQDVIRSLLKDADDIDQKKMLKKLDSQDKPIQRPSSANFLQMKTQPVRRIRSAVVHQQRSAICNRKKSISGDGGDGQGSWKPLYNPSKTVTDQCLEQIATCCSYAVLDMLSSPDLTIRKKAIETLCHVTQDSNENLVNPIAQQGLVPKLIDFLRVSDQGELQVIALQTLVNVTTKNDRMKSAFDFYGATKLLIAMTSNSNGKVKQKTAECLRCLSRKSMAPTSNKNESSIQARRRYIPGHQGPSDIWDKIQSRWESEDKVAQLLFEGDKQYIPSRPQTLLSNLVPQ